ncbi:MAG TPA: alanine racemase [Vicinamibacterales bacterium]|nr:alanine racemase [Vicinamibacterales bacterium]
MTESLHSIPTPRVYIDRSRLQTNIAVMQSRASSAGIRLRPHAKTHKSPAIARMQIDAGAVGVCCAKLGEAEVFADAGINDIRLPYPTNPMNANRVLMLQDRVRLSIVVDNLEVARQWSDVMAGAGRHLDVLIKVDVGFHRCGINPDASDALETAREIAACPGLRFLGLLSHAGHGYHAESATTLEQIAAREVEILSHLADGLRTAGFDVREISVGATPTARFVTSQTGVTEMRPGNYVFFDRTQVGLGSATLDQCSLGVVATVVSRPDAARVVFDAGSKTLSTDGLRGFGTTVGYGFVYASLEARTPDPSIVIERLSEEHSVAKVTPDCRLKPGDRVHILPNHACVVANLAEELLLVDGLAIVDRIPVAARAKVW